MSKENPQLTIVGGPNGAGKSTYSRDLSPKGAIVLMQTSYQRVLLPVYPQTYLSKVFTLLCNQYSLTL